MAKFRPHHFRKGAFTLLWILPIAAAFFLVWKHHVGLPVWDEWHTPGAQLASWYRGTLTFAELWSQHNESRKLVPRLIYLPLFLVAGWNVRLALVLVFAAACLLSAGLFNLARRTIPPAATAGLAFLVMNLLVFSPRQYESFRNDIQWETFAPGVALVFALLVNLSGRALASKTVCNALLALISTYTFANGMLIWLLAFPVATGADDSSRPKLFWRLIYILAGAVCIGCYFIGYQHPLLSPPTASLPTDAPALTQFFLIWFGSLFRVPNPAVAGAAIVLAFVSLAGISAWLMRQRREWQSSYPWLILGAYALISGAVTAAARLGFGLAMAADARYTVFSVFLYIAVIGLAFTVYEQLRGSRNLARAGTVLAAAAGLVLLACWASTFTAERRLLKNVTQYHRHLLLVLRWAEAIPHNPELAWLSPYPEMPQTIHALAQSDALRPRLVSKALGQAVTAPPAGTGDGAGILEQAAPDGNGRLLVKGWALVPNENRPADCVVLGWETAAGWEPRWVLETGRQSHDFVISGAGFSGPMIATAPPSGAMVRAWAIDLQRDQAFPLAGAIKVAP